MTASDENLLDITGYDNREALIRGHWKKFGFHWDVSKIGPRLNIPVQHKVPCCPVKREDIETSKTVLNYLTYEIEVGSHDQGRRPYRVKCEDVIVEDGFI